MVLSSCQDEEQPVLGCIAAHLAFPLMWQTTLSSMPIASLPHLPITPFHLPSSSPLTPSPPVCSLPLTNTPKHISLHTFSLPEIREAFCQLLPYNISLPQYSLSILKWWWGRSHFSLYPPNEQSSALKYFSSIVTETAVGFHPKNQKDNYT